ncbi:hypothetical protein AAY473_031311 [Plecturocebus cupreus]
MDIINTHGWPGTVAHTCNPSTLGGQDPRLTGSMRRTDTQGNRSVHQRRAKPYPSKRSSKEDLSSCLSGSCFTFNLVQLALSICIKENEQSPHSNSPQCYVEMGFHYVSRDGLDLLTL